MTDVVRAKKIKDFAYFIHYDNPENGLNADILSIKFPESEKKHIGAKASLMHLFGAGEYGKEQAGNKWETFVFTKSFGMLPMEAWQAKTAEGLTAASGNKVLPSNVSSPVLVGGYFDEAYFDSAYFDAGHYECPKCGVRLAIQENLNYCFSCGQKLDNVPKLDRKRGVPQV
jgi:hypothetical protein